MGLTHERTAPRRPKVARRRVEEKTSSKMHRFPAHYVQEPRSPECVLIKWDEGVHPAANKRYTDRMQREHATYTDTEKKNEHGLLYL